LRNYINEVLRVGHTFQEISKDSGLSILRLKAIKSGKVKLRSGTIQYEKVRNISRRFSYRDLKSLNVPVSTKEATRLRRGLYSQKNVKRPKIKMIKHFLKEKAEKARRSQMYILAEARDSKTKEIKLAYGFSLNRARVNKRIMKRECVDFIQAHLGGSNWKIKRIIETGIIQKDYIISGKNVSSSKKK